MTNMEQNSKSLKISIILTTYNRSHLLLKSINSVLTNNYKNFELIIVNDCSIDNTDEIVNKINDNRVFYIKHSSNLGVLAARNSGFNKCTGDLITILDDDDLLIFNALEQIVYYYNKVEIKKRGILWFDCIDKESNKISGIMPIKSGEILFEDYVCGNIHGDFLLVFENRMLKHLRFDERLRAHESLLWLKLHREYPANYFPVVLCEKYRNHGERLCDLNVRLKQLPQSLLALSEFIFQFGTELKDLCPARYGQKLAYLGLHQLMVGDYKSGRVSIKNSLSYKFSIKYWLLYIFSYIFNKKIILKIYILNEK